MGTKTGEKVGIGLREVGCKNIHHLLRAANKFKRFVIGSMYIHVRRKAKLLEYKSDYEKCATMSKGSDVG
ncbi:MAG TPA: hypothetical protein VGO47_06405 [Chlamydiales bacterium]|nr:hypothetical protein [Chlamydiales bacterium]